MEKWDFHYFVIHDQLKHFALVASRDDRYGSKTLLEKYYMILITNILMKFLSVTSSKGNP